MKPIKFQQATIYKALNTIKELLPYCDKNVTLYDKKDKAFVNQQINMLWENVKSFPDNSSFSFLRSIRNTFSHLQENLSDEKLQNLYKQVFPVLPDLKQNLERKLTVDLKNPIKRRFKKFGPNVLGTETERTQLIDAIENSCTEKVDNQEQIDFPDNELSKNVKKIINETIDSQENRKYIAEHEGLSQNIQNDLLEWVQKVDSAIKQENPFVKETQFIQNLKSQETKDLEKNFATNEKEYKKLVSDCKVDFNFYQQQLTPKKQENSKKKVVTIDQKTIFSSMFEDMEKDLLERKAKWELQKIDEMRRLFTKELLEKLEKFKKLEAVLHGFITNCGRLWDLTKTDFNDYNFDILSEYADILERDESLKEFANLLGRQTKEQQKFEKELRDKIVVTTEYHPQPAYRGQICGVTTGNSISSVLPSELALLKNPATKNLFKLKFAQKQLLSFRYENQVASERRTIEQEEVEVSVNEKEPKGPIIICVDTSGSMQGTPEMVAKTVTFALAKIAIEEKRNCYLISFSTNIETLDLSDFSNTKPLDNLVGFLRMSFWGGTDATPALAQALKMLKQKAYKNADVLMVSDFVMGTLPQEIDEAIKIEQKKETQFYSLVIGQTGNQNTIESFNHNWSYNTNDRFSNRHLVENLHSLRSRE